MSAQHMNLTTQGKGMKETVLILAPHTDDESFGCGGTIARIVEEYGCESVHAVAFSICEESVPAGFPKDALKVEFLAAQAAYGIPRENVHVFDYPVRRFPQYRQEILEEMIRLRKVIRPTLVFAPSVRDMHQDHSTIAEEAFRAFKACKLLSYEIAWNHLEFHNQVYIKLEDRHIDRKLNALSCYKTQSFRSYSGGEYVKSQAICRGAQVACKYAEVFELVRAVL